MGYNAGQKVRTSDLSATDTRSTYSWYSGTNTATSLNAWVALPFATLSKGSGTGLTVAANTSFTLVTPGTWRVVFSGLVDQASHTGVTGSVFGLCNNSAGTGANNFYAQQNCPIGAGQSAGTVTADIDSDGTFVVCAMIYTLGANSAMQTTGGVSPRLTFKWLPD
jgi:hypothetical protein